MKSFVVATLAAFVAGYRMEHEAHFMNFVASHGKVYRTVTEYKIRKMLWEEADKFIRTHNSQHESYILGHNQFSDWSHEEFKRLMGSESDGTFQYAHVGKFDTDHLPHAVDWSAKKAVSGIKDQNKCGADWAFAAIGAIESAYKINKGSLYSLSEQ
jgi:C1A family cysteine protease